MQTKNDERDIENCELGVYGDHETVLNILQNPEEFNLKNRQ